MEPPPRRSHEDAGYLSLGVEELQEEPHDTKPTAATSVIVTGKAVEEDPRPEPEQGAAAAEQGRVGAGAPGPMDDENQKGGGGGGEESPQKEQQLAHAATEDPEREGSQLFFPCNPYGLVVVSGSELGPSLAYFPQLYRLKYRGFVQGVSNSYVPHSGEKGKQTGRRPDANPALPVVRTARPSLRAQSAFPQPPSPSCREGLRRGAPPEQRRWRGVSQARGLRRKMEKEEEVKEQRGSGRWKAPHILN
nr:unnamed protein product [Camelus bactrianus]